MDIVIRTLESKRLAAVVTRRPSMSFQGAWGELRPAVAAQGLVRPGAEFAAVFNATELTGPGAMKWYAATMRVEEDQPLAAPLEALRIEGGAFAMATHRGSFEGLGAAWGDFAKSLHAAGHALEMRRPCFEIYFGEASGAEAGGARVELFVPVRA